jgi:hypothetical protein
LRELLVGRLVAVKHVHDLLLDCFLQFLLLVVGLNPRLELVLLRLDEGKDDNSKNEVHKEELAHDHHQDDIDSTEDWDVYVHQVAHLLKPGV